MTCIGSGFYVGSLVKHRGTVKSVLAIEYILEADYSTIYPGKRTVTYLRLGNQLVHPSEVELMPTNDNDVTGIVIPKISVCGRIIKHIPKPNIPIMPDNSNESSVSNESNESSISETISSSSESTLSSTSITSVNSFSTSSSKSILSSSTSQSSFSTYSTLDDASTESSLSSDSTLNNASTESSLSSVSTESLSTLSTLSSVSTESISTLSSVSTESILDISAFTLVDLDGSSVADDDDVGGFTFASGNSSLMIAANVRQPGSVSWLVKTSDALQTQTDYASPASGMMVPLWMSADGNTIFARQVNPSSHLYKSINGGVNWTDVDSHCVLHISNNGLNMLALAIGSYQNLEYSTNGGTDWTASTGEAPSFDFGAQGYVTCSNDGSKILMNTSASDNIYMSTDYGATFSLYTTGANFHTIKVDNTGIIWRISSFGGNISYYDGSWVAVYSTGYNAAAPSGIREIDCCSGSNMVLSPDAKVIVTRGAISNDYGATFTDISALIPYISITESRLAVSDDGLKIAMQAGSAGGGTDDAIYVNR